jgi:hypothetical protein
MDAQMEKVATEWLTKHRYTSDPRTLSLIVRRAEQLVAELGGYPAVAHLERSYLELLNAGEIKKFGTFESQRQQAPEIPKDIPRTAAQYHQLPARIIALRYQREPAFKAAIDALIAQGAIAFLLALLSHVVLS